MQESGAELKVLREHPEQNGMESYFERTKEVSELPGLRQASIIPVEPTAMRETPEKGFYSQTQSEKREFATSMCVVNKQQCN